jgi:hypothetical protein
MREQQNVRASGQKTCTLWTPWGPQAAMPESPRQSRLRKTIRRLKTSRSDAIKSTTADLALPECAYEP